MAKVKLESMVKEAGGKTDKVVHYNRLGTQCARRHVIPANPDTELQRINRKAFADAVKEWQKLTEDEKRYWNKKAVKLLRKGKTGKTGYSVFLSVYLTNSVRRG